METSPNTKGTPVDSSVRNAALLYAAYLTFFVVGLTLITKLTPGALMTNVIGTNFFFMLVLAYAPVLSLRPFGGPFLTHAALLPTVAAGLWAWFNISGFHLPTSNAAPPALGLAEMMLGIATYMIVSSASLWIAKGAMRSRAGLIATHR